MEKGYRHKPLTK